MFPGIKDLTQLPFLSVAVMQFLSPNEFVLQTVSAFALIELAQRISEVSVVITKLFGNEKNILFLRFIFLKLSDYITDTAKNRTT